MDYGVPTEYNEEIARLGRRRLKAMRSRIELALLGGVSRERVADWLIESGCTPALAEWLIEDFRGRSQVEERFTHHHWMLGKPLKVRSPLEVLSSALLACAWIFLFIVVWRTVSGWSDLLAFAVAFAIGMASIKLLGDLLELRACLAEWRERRAVGRQTRDR